MHGNKLQNAPYARPTRADPRAKMCAAATTKPANMSFVNTKPPEMRYNVHSPAAGFHMWEVC